MSSSNHGHSKPSRNRNRLSLFLFLSSSRKSSKTSTAGMPYSPTTSFASHCEHMPTSPTASVAAHSLAPPTPIASIASHSFIHMDAGAPLSNEAVPPTTNELDVKEKARLLKKARKLSRVFGDDSALSHVAPVKPRPSSSSLHRRSTSSIAASAETHSSGRRPPRKSPSYPEIKAASSEDSGLLQINEAPPPLPPLPTADQLQRKIAMPSSQASPPLSALSTADQSQWRIVTPSSAPASLSHEESSSLSITTTSLKPLQDDQLSIHSITPTTPTFPSAEQSRRARMAKLRRFLGEDNIPPHLVSHPLRSRKSYDSSLATLASAPPQAARTKYVKRSQSLARQTQREDGETTEDAVDFHRRYVQTFGKMGHRQNQRRIHTSASAIAETIEAVEPLPSKVDPEKTLLKSQSMASIRTVSTTTGTEPRPSTISSHQSSKHPDAGERIPASTSSGSIQSNESNVSDSGIDPSFRERRRRAAKLAQFFGVGYQDISASLPISNAVPSLPSPGSNSPQAGVQVDIKMNSKKFWGFNDGRGTLRDADMADVIDKLRDLRAS